MVGALLVWMLRERQVVAGLAEEGAYRWRGIVSVHVRFA
jgi:hypothetical protein